MRSFFSIPLLSLFAFSCSASSGDGDAGDGDGDTDGPGDGDGTGGLSGDGDGDLGPGSGGASTGGGSGTGGGSPGSGGSATVGALFSSNFDSDQAGAIEKDGPTWTHLFEEWDTAGVASVVGDKSHSAPNSAYVKKGSANQGWLQLKDASVFPFSGDKLHVRAYINVPEWPSGHTSWMEIGATVNEQNEMRVGSNSSMLEVNHYPGDEETVAPGITLTPNLWHCLEYAYDKAANNLEVWLDGTKIEALNVVGGEFGNAPGSSVAPVPIEAVRFGAEIAATEAWFDDIVVGTSLIGCD